jgi:fructoselysine-6-P-deglycase FrlB-like protein
MSITDTEITTQPDMWRRTAALLPDVRSLLPAPGRRVALLGCGTSFYIAQSIALLREALQQGETDAFVASEVPTGRRYDQVIAISRSGTTTEVVRALEGAPDGVPSLAISAVADSPVVRAADEAIIMDYSDEVSVVQTRFATSVLALLRAHLGVDLAPAIEQAQSSLSRSLPVDVTDFEQFVFLGTGWTLGLASEAALKFREACLAWTESYYAGEYRHGPISVAGDRTLVWLLGVDDDSLVQDIRATGATVRVGEGDPMAELVTIQRAAMALAQARGLNPDEPRHLSRSVVLS